MDDFQKRFKASVEPNVRGVSTKPLPESAHRRVRLRRTLLATGSTLIVALVAAGGIGLAIQTTRDSDPLPATEESPPRPSPTPADEQRSAQLDWPPPFVPEVRAEGDRNIMTVVFPDRTVARLSYPAELRLAEMGLQPMINYSLQEGRPNPPHDIIFIPGEAPVGLLDPEPLETFGDAIPQRTSLHEIVYKHLNDDPPFALVYEKDGWTIVATMQRREDAQVLAANLHPSVSADGWPTVSATGPVRLSEGFGEARGAHLAIGDRNPLFDLTDAGDDSAYILMGPNRGCAQADDGVSNLGGQWYGAKCLEFTGGELGMFMSINGPEDFVRAVHRGIELDDGS